MFRARLKFTYEDYRNTPEDKRYELLDGDLIVVPAPRPYHQDISRNLEWLLWQFVKSHDLGKIYDSPIDVVLSDTDIVQPDLLFISKERIHIVTEMEILGAPDLVIEILSPGTAERDRTYKRSLYARHGVREYWLIDANSRTVEVLRLGTGGFESAAVFGREDVLATPLLKGLRLNLSEVF